MRKNIGKLKLGRILSVKYLPIFIIVFGLIIAGFILFQPNKSIPSSNVADVNSCLSQNNFKCYEKYFTAKTKTSNPITALADLEKYSQQNGYVKSQCHQFAHVIGHAGYEKYGSLSKAYSMGGSYCWSGYYHGVTESAVGAIGADKIKEQANTICAELATKQLYSFDHFNCVHGMGHGFMTIDNFNLFKALSSCDLLTGSWEQNSCYGGVFMENVMVSVRDNGHSEFLRTNELMYPCSEVITRYKQQCYLMQTSYALQQSDQDFVKVASLCQNIVDTDFVATCFQSLGRDASGSSNSDISTTKSKCQVAPGDNLENCVMGAVRDIVSYFHDDAQAKLFCKLYPPNLSDKCLAEVTKYYSSFTPREN